MFAYFKDPKFDHYYRTFVRTLHEIHISYAQTYSVYDFKLAVMSM